MIHDKVIKEDTSRLVSLAVKKELEDLLNLGYTIIAVSHEYNYLDSIHTAYIYFKS